MVLESVVQYDDDRTGIGVDGNIGRHASVVSAGGSAAKFGSHRRLQASGPRGSRISRPATSSRPSGSSAIELHSAPRHHPCIPIPVPLAVNASTRHPWKTKVCLPRSGSRRYTRSECVTGLDHLVAGETEKDACGSKRIVQARQWEGVAGP